MLVAHDAFVTFGYGFGDMDALTRINFSWLIGPVMSAVGAQSICYLSSLTYHGFSFLCRPGLLCIPDLHSVKITNYPYIHHLCESLLCSFSGCLAHLFTGIIDQFCGSYDHRY